MRYHDITTNDMKNGDGLRTVLWVSGCSHKCKNCHNRITWDPDDGLIFDKKVKDELFQKLKEDQISGITLSGGDPLFYKNRIEILSLVKEIRDIFPNKTIWLYTGYLYEDILEDEVMFEIIKYVDVLVDGEFKEELKDVNYHWAGSTNQRVIDVQKSLKKGSVIYHE